MEIPELNANSVYPDHTPRFMYLGLYSLTISLFTGRLGLLFFFFFFFFFFSFFFSCLVLYTEEVNLQTFFVI